MSSRPATRPCDTADREACLAVFESNVPRYFTSAVRRLPGRTSGSFLRLVGFYERRSYRTVRIDPEGYGPGLERCEMELLIHQTPVAID